MQNVIFVRIIKLFTVAKSCFRKLFVPLHKLRFMAQIRDIIDNNGGFISVEDIPNRAEYLRVVRAVDQGELIRVRHGVYALPEMLMNTMIDLERIVPDGVVCLYNAWAYHQLSTTVPSGFSVAVNNKRKVSLPEELPITLYYWKKEYLEFGIIQEQISNYSVRITDIERSVCDAVRYRKKVGMDICMEVVKSYMARPSRNISKLMGYAQKLRVAKILNNYLEIILE